MTNDATLLMILFFAIATETVAGALVAAFGVLPPSLGIALSAGIGSCDGNTDALLSSFETREVGTAAFENEPPPGPMTTETRLRASELAPHPDEARASPTPALRSHQRSSMTIASSFVPRQFDPPPLLSNEHLQTIGGVYLRHRPECAYLTDSGLGVGAAWNALSGLTAGDRPDETKCNYWDERERIVTTDGDYFHVDYKYFDGDVEDAANGNKRVRLGRPSIESRGTIFLLHGLESNSNSSLSTNMAASYIRRGFDVACLNFRGCCGAADDRTQLAGYHLGFTEDIKHMLEIHTERWRGNGTDDRLVYISGFSLGANVALKALGELGEKARTRYGVRGAAVTGAPFDNELNIKKVESPGFNKVVYGNTFLKSMKARLSQQIDELCLVDGEDYETANEGATVRRVNFGDCLSVDTIADMETNLISPLYGFEDNVDYYRKCSCVYFLEGIAVPTLIINAADDPFFDPTCWPTDKSSVDGGGGVAPIKMVRTDHGGHLGFMFHRPSDVEKREAIAMAGRESWMPTELARFLDHVANSQGVDAGADEMSKVASLESW